MKTPPKGQRQRPLERLLGLLLARADALSLLLLAAGLLGFAALPLLQRRISFDENALLAGSSRPTIRERSPEAFTAAAQLAAALEPHFRTPRFGEQLRGALSKAGLETYDQPFSVTRRGGGGGGGELRCSNVHAVLRSPRGDGKEALVLVTPVTLQPFATDFNQTAAGASLAVSLVHALLLHLRSAPWLAKDVIWVVADASCGLVEGVAAWVGEYQQTPTPRHVRSLAGAAPFGRAGVLQQGVVVEAADGRVGGLDLPLPGYDGQLPKLDMYWLLKSYTSGWVSAPFAGEPAPPPPPPLRAAAAAAAAAFGADAADAEAHAARLASMAAFAWAQARGLPLGAHAPFKTAAVDAVTLRLLPGGGGGRPSLDASSARAQLAEALELAVRSCSGLIEKFHHSFFLYVLVGTRHFVSVEQYIGVVVAPLLALVLQAARLKREQDEALGEEPPLAALAADRAQWGAAARRVLLAHALCAAAGLALREGPAIAAAAGGGTAALPDAGAAVGLGLLLALGVGECAQLLLGGRSDSKSVGTSGQRQQEQQQQQQRAAWRRKQAIVQLSAAAAVLAALACLNWALAYAAALALAPLAIACRGRAGAGSSLGRAAAVLVWALFSPPALLQAAYAVSGHARAALLQPGQLQWLLLGSSDAAYAVFWGLYLPFWALHGSIALGGR
ncbi:glycosylphosphatidylinositol anchor attachment [Raphidocelis subcapitata]|uniref:Glycosylphosphatidylinositol anchor attachment n=1 Tax=Raphidocelis subcapitata TaxID=307507 RepID=A0A2V0PGT1_9CHLO|nr:glycosylphosphatidylinositol anchor attachment [Raphidocelis subcapitata]|eukprot:GBF97123.1 glycosylphosphatidylinositol anchor attachment [Raphidocelis subcapitata]